MRFTEVNLFGVYVAPISALMVAAWLILVPLRRIANHFSLLQHVWHPVLVEFAAYVIVLAALVFLVGR